jgi:hypothetical protein
MGGFDFSFLSAQQRARLEEHAAAIRSWNWPMIRSTVAERGEYILGRARDLEPAGEISPAERTQAEQEERALWHYAALQVVLKEEQMQYGRRSEPGSGEDLLYLTACAWPVPEALRGIVPEEEEDDEEDL